MSWPTIKRQDSTLLHRQLLIRVGFPAPAWSQGGGRVATRRPQVEDHQIGMPGDGWQQAATDAVHTHLVETSVRPRLSATEQAMLRSQGGPLSGVPFSCFPTSALSRFDASQFRVLMLRRLWLPLPPSSRNFRCGRLLDVLGHHRAACAEAGVLGRRGFALESVAARICREAGARVGTNVMVRDMDSLPQSHLDTRRLEVVADGLPLFHGAQSAIDTTMVSAVRRDGLPRPRSVRDDGAALATARRLKERTHPELTGQFGRARLVVLACEVGGRWLGETQAFLRQLAKFKARTEALPQQSRARAAWLLWRRTMLACSGAGALAQSLMEVRPSGRCDGPTPTHAEVVSEHRHVSVVGWGLGPLFSRGTVTDFTISSQKEKQFVMSFGT